MSLPDPRKFGINVPSEVARYFPKDSTPTSSRPSSSTVPALTQPAQARTTLPDPREFGINVAPDTAQFWPDGQGAKIDLSTFGRGVNQQSTPGGGLTDFQKNTIAQFKSSLDGYDWRADYKYDAFSEEDARRKAEGEMPESVYKKYKMDDPVDAALYAAGMPPRSDLENAVKKADKWRETKGALAEPLLEADNRSPFRKTLDWAAETAQEVNAQRDEQAQEPAKQSVDSLIDALFVDEGEPKARSTTGLMGGVNALVDRLRNAAKGDDELSFLLGVSDAESRIRQNERGKEAAIAALERQFESDPTFDGAPTTTRLGSMGGAWIERVDKSAARTAAENAFKAEQERIWLEAAGAPEGASRYEYEPNIVAKRLALVRKYPDFAQVSAKPFTAAEIIEAGPIEVEPGKTRRFADYYNSVQDVMTDEEKAVLAYHVRTAEDSELKDAQEYIEAITPVLDLRKSALIAANHEGDKTLGSVMTAAVAGLENGIRGLRRAFNADNYALRGEGAWGQAHRELRAETVGIAGIASDLLYTVGNMVPAIAAGTATGNPAIGAATLGAGTAGNGYNEIKRAGGTDAEAATFGILTGLSESMLQYFLGGIAKLGKAGSGEAGKTITKALSRVFKNPKALKVIESTAGRWLAGKARNAAGEALEEYLQTAVIEPVIRNVALGEDLEMDLLSEEAVYAAALGALSSLLFPGGAPETDSAVQAGPEVAVAEQTETDIDLPFSEPPPDIDTYTDPLIDDIESEYLALEREAIANEPTMLELGDMADAAQDEYSDPLIDTIQVPRRVAESGMDSMPADIDVQTGTDADAIVAPELDADAIAAHYADQANAEETARQIKSKEQQLSEAKEPLGTDMLTPDEAGLAASLPGQLKDKLNYNRTTEQNLNTLAGNNKTARTALYELVDKPHREAQAKESRMVRTLGTEHAEIMKRLGLTERDTWGARWYGEGVKTHDENGLRLRDADGKPAFIPYGLDDLKAEFPAKWREIAELDTFYRGKLDALADELDATLKRNYPHEERRAKRKMDDLTDTVEMKKSKARKANDRAQAKSAALEQSIRDLSAADDVAASRAAELQRQIANKEHLIEQLSTQALQAVEAADGKARTDTKAYEALQNRIARLEEQALRERIALDGMLDALDQRIDRLHGQKNYMELRNRVDRARHEYAKAKDEAAQAWAVVRTVQAEMEAHRAAMADGTLYGNRRFQYRKKYYPHKLHKDTGVKGLKQALQSDATIDPMLAGTSEFTKPKSRWAGFMQQREGMNTAREMSPMAAFEAYYPEAARKIAFDPFIARMREFVNIIRVSSGLPAMDADAQVTDIKEGRKIAKGPNNQLIVYLDQWTNQLAGKTNQIDRVISDRTSRNSLLALKWFNSRVKANAVSGNVRSAVAQFFNIPNAAMYVKNPVYWAKGARDMFLRLFGKSDAITAIYNESGFLSGRMVERDLRKARSGTELAAGKLQNASTALLEVGDLFSAELMWWAAHERARAELTAINTSRLYHRTFENPVDFADYVARSASAGREMGDVPLNQDSVLTGLLAPFQVEVNNQWQVVKERAAKGDLGALLALLIATWLMNEGSEELTGDRIGGFDILDALTDVVSAVNSEEWATLETSDKLAATGGRVAGEILSAMPFGTQVVSTIVGGDEALAEKLFGKEGDPTRYGTGAIGAAALTVPIARAISGKQDNYLTDALFKFGTPFGGRGLSRLHDTAKNMGWLPDINFGINDLFTAKQAKAPTSYTAGGNVRFATDTDPFSVLQSALFGQYSTPSGKAYMQGGGKPLSDKKTDVYDQLIEGGTDAHAVEGALRMLTGSDTEKRKGLYANDTLTAQEKALISTDLIGNGRFIDYFNGDAAFALSLDGAETYAKAEAARTVGVTWEQYKAYFDYKKTLRKQDKLNAVELMKYLNRTDLTDAQKKHLYEEHYKWDNRPR